MEAALAIADGILLDPLKAELRSILHNVSTAGPHLALDDRIVLGGEVVSALQEELVLALFPFKPTLGFEAAPCDEKMVRVRIPGLGDRSIHTVPGVQIMCAGKPLSWNDMVYEFDSHVAVTFRPENSDAMPWNFLHLFSGSFGGWSQAASFLQRADQGFSLGQEVFVDNDETVMQIWSAQAGSRHFRGPLAHNTKWSPAAKIGILTSVGDWSLANACRIQTNLCCTVSPPCQSWSKAGRRLGLQDSNGWAFIDAIKMITIVQPITVAMECSDEITEHPHFKILEALIHSLGFRRTWTQVTPYQALADHARSRWLCTWARADVQAQTIGFTFALKASPKTPWDDPVYHFRIPDVWVNQLVLSESERAIYNDPRLLPGSKRKRSDGDSSGALHTLWARVPNGHEPLPTLCASYSSQHTLAKVHVQDRGLFAFLNHTSRGFEFFDPARFCGLLGVTEDRTFPTKVQSAFRGIGNAISVPHGLLALSIAMHTVGQTSVDPLKAVRQAWHARLCARNAVLFHHDAFVHLVHVDHVAQWVSIKVLPEVHDSCRVLLQGSFGHHRIRAYLPHDASCGQSLHMLFAGPKELIDVIAFRAQDNNPNKHSCIGQLADPDTCWEFVVAGTPVGSCSIALAPKTEVIDVPDDDDIPIDKVYQIADELSFEDTCKQSWFQKVLSCCDRLTPGYGTSQRVVFLHSVGQCDFQVCGKGSEIKSISDEITYAWNGQVVDMPNEHVPLTHLVCGVDESIDGQVQVAVYLQADDKFCLLHLPSTISTCTTFEWKKKRLAITAINGTPPQQSCIRLHANDVLIVGSEELIRAGGHHEAPGPRPSLPASAPFVDRAEFMCNTQGWIASDEMAMYTQEIQWHQMFYKFTPPVFWDPHQDDFEFPESGEIHIFNGCTTVVPILITNHWSAVEIHRGEHGTRVVFVQVPQNVRTKLTHMVARLLDIAPHRFEVAHEGDGAPPHLCGWFLLYRWIGHFNMQNNLANQVNQSPLPRHVVEIIDTCIQCSIEDWRRCNMPQDVAQVALQLRRNFLWHRARREAIGQPVIQPRLTVAIPTPQPVIREQPQEPPSAITEILARLHHFQQYPGWAATDEVDYTMDLLRSHHPETLFCPPAVWLPTRSEFMYLNDYVPDISSYSHIFWTVVTMNHWVQIELYLAPENARFYFTVPNTIQQTLLPLINYIIGIARVEPETVTVETIHQDTPHGLCGYHMLHQLFHRVSLDFAPLRDPQLQTIWRHQLGEELEEIRNEARLVWHNSGAEEELIEFAANVRDWFLIRVLERRFPDQYIAGGAADDVDMASQDASTKSKSKAPEVPPGSGGLSASSKAPNDPWLHNDPWSKRPPRPSQSKWEDLVIKEPVPFVDEHDKHLSQTHRLQLAPSRGGVVLATKSHLPEISKIQAAPHLCVLIPASDSPSLAHLANRMEGPYEVSLHDNTAKISYKRLVHMLVFAGKVRFQLPEATYKMTTPAVAEVVLEFDSRLTSKSDIDKIKESPIAMFKQAVNEAIPKLSAAITLYGYRIAHHPGATKQECQLQCVLKAPSISRKALLECSGASNLLVRDYLEKGKGSEDTTVLPRFWMVTAQELHKMRIVVQGAPGFAGIIVTRRGLAVRVWADQIKEARQALMSADNRLVPENLHVIPKVSLELSGWPAATDASNVVQSTLAALKLPVIPMRTYRAAGVHTWVVTAQELPNAFRFTLEINKELVEILVQEVSMNQPVRPPAKGKSKGKSKSNDAQPEPNSAWPLKMPVQAQGRSEEIRLDRLEERFEKLESRQAQFEGRVDSKFDTIQDSLRQLLANTNPRTRDASGGTPPGKHQKNS